LARSTPRPSARAARASPASCPPPATADERAAEAAEEAPSRYASCATDIFFSFGESLAFASAGSGPAAPPERVTDRALDTGDERQSCLS